MINIPTLEQKHFLYIKSMVAEHGGICLVSGKEELVRARLSRRLSELKLNTFDEYLKIMDEDKTGREIETMLDLISTNVTYFLREIDHFHYLKEVVLPEYLNDCFSRPNSLRIWSAGCSSGEEAYSLAFTILETSAAFKAWDVKILGTDISTRVLAQARKGQYELDKMVCLGPERIKKNFNIIKDHGKRVGQIKSNVKRMVSFARMNLTRAWPIKGPFEIIFCRNVMIYFDNNIRQQLVKRFWEILKPGGWLIVGHSESLRMVEHKFEYLQPTIYRKR